jgi:hypothetical protein
MPATKWGHKKQCKIVIFHNFEMSPCCRGNRKFKIEHVVTEFMVLSTHVPSFISIEAFFHTFIAVGTCNRRLFNENGHFHIYAHWVKG